MTSRLIGPTAAAIVKPRMKPRNANAGSTGSPFGSMDKKNALGVCAGASLGLVVGAHRARASGRGGPGGPLLACAWRDGRGHVGAGWGMRGAPLSTARLATLRP